MTKRRKRQQSTQRWQASAKCARQFRLGSAFRTLKVRQNEREGAGSGMREHTGEHHPTRQKPAHNSQKIAIMFFSFFLLSS
jgi:hypothetical protein